MARRLDIGKEATFNHARVVYSPFGADPGAQFVLTADPWSYLTAVINQSLARRPRGDNKRRLQRALYYANLAESFYRSARDSTLPASGTLAYYGVLNLVKCFLSIREVDLETRIEHHGLSLPLGTKQTIQVASPPQNSLHIFHEFARQLGKPVTAKEDMVLKDIAGHLPEIHEMAFTLGHVPGNRRGFLPIDIRFLFSTKNAHVFTEVSYDKKQLTRVDTKRFMTGRRGAYFRAGEERAGVLVHRAQRRKSFTWRNLPKKYSNICAEYASFDIGSLLTSSGYKYYCDLHDPKYHHLSYALMMMYYIGTVARYRPSEMSELLGSDMRPLVAEALSVVPGQMLYHLVSLCTSRNCVVPHSTVAR